MSIESLKAKGYCILTWNEIRNGDAMKKKPVKRPVKKTRKPKPTGTY